ncbi:kinase-like protein [Amniculicola lignicola CBS 123094]|uniref:Kinase-like protein n=1 Tax=Amniculicola lignicola CBS 123094 TaxID=1392246 RepID=A0A6A5WXX1_9PLEO|nr:kinase-like protein [Amniculicola lignicola CBS 123094]
MALRIGQVLRGAKGKYELLEQLKGSSVFKARVLSNPLIQGEWAVMKSAATNDERIALKREYRNYGILEIATCPYIRTLHDTVQSNEDQHNPGCLVFEWMDLDLRSVQANQFRGNPRLPKVVSKAVLSALRLFKKLSVVHTDVNVNNVYISDINGPSPIAKLGDLGNLIPEGSTKQRGQSLPCRAPEVWQGLGCQHSSDVWSLGVTLARQLSPHPLFGPSDKIIEGFTEAWCIAKIIRLLGPLRQPVDCQPYREEFELAEQLAVMENPHNGTRLIKGGTLREELQRLPEPSVSPKLLDFIESLLVVDHSKRPTASEALQHPYLQSFT